MATIIERPDTTRVVEDRTYYDSSDSSGWAVALIILAALALLALFAWPNLVNRTAAPASVPSTIQVNVPETNRSPVAPSSPIDDTGPAPGSVQQVP